MWRYSLILLVPLSLAWTQERDRIIFPHDFHLEEMELDCDHCHAGVSASQSLRERLLPAMESCSDCHDGDTAGEECELCHSAPEEPISYPSLAPREGPDFAHQFHLLKGLDCSTCHSGIYSDDGSAARGDWTTADCYRCHQSRRPENHALDWVSTHGLDLGHRVQESCRLCHTQSSCDRCHQLQQFELEVHPVAYLLRHGFEARSGEKECSTCHAVTTDCYRCHRDNGVMPLDHNLPGWAGPFLDDGGSHGEAALEEPEICQTCHLPASDRTCLRCHGGD